MGGAEGRTVEGAVEGAVEAQWQRTGRERVAELLGQKGNCGTNGHKDTRVACGCQGRSGCLFVMQTQSAGASGTLWAMGAGVSGCGGAARGASARKSAAERRHSFVKPDAVFDRFLSEIDDCRLYYVFLTPLRAAKSARW